MNEPPAPPPPPAPADRTYLAQQVPAAPPPPPALPFGPLKTKKKNWREERKKRETLERQSATFFSGPLHFPREAWKEGPLHLARLPSSDGHSSAALRLTLNAIQTTVVVKGSPQIAQEWLGLQCVARSLGTSAAPRCRLVDFSSPEWSLLKKSCFALDPSSTSNCLDRPILMVMEWIEGVPVSDLGGGVYLPALLRSLGQHQHWSPVSPVSVH